MTSDQPRTSTSRVFTFEVVWERPPGRLLQHPVCINKASQSQSSAGSWSSSGSPPDCSHHHLHLMLQDRARPHVARISTQLLEAENIPVLTPDMSAIQHVWEALDWRSGATFHRPHYQPAQLYEEEMCCTASGVVLYFSSKHADKPRRVLIFSV